MGSRSVPPSNSRAMTHDEPLKRMCPRGRQFVGNPSIFAYLHTNVPTWAPDDVMARPRASGQELAVKVAHHFWPSGHACLTALPDRNALQTLAAAKAGFEGRKLVEFASCRVSRVGC